MFKPNPLWSQSLALSDLSSPNPQEPRFRHPTESLDLHAFNDSILRRENPCVVQREVSNYRKKLVVGVRQHRKLFETVEETSLRAQMKVVRQQEQPLLFASLRKQGHTRGSQKSVSRLCIQPARKQKKQDNQSAEGEFLSVGKMALVGERSKKSQSMMLVSGGEETVNRVERYLPCSQLIREINVIKEKFNIQRILTAHTNQGDQNQEVTKNFSRFINIKRYQPHKKRKNNPTPHPQLSPVDGIPLTQSVKVHKPAITRSKLQLAHTQPTQTSPLKRAAKRGKAFVVPFETYHYRDMLWKVNFSNSLLVEVPIEYEQRLRVYVGKGNNSCMVASLIARRPWFVVTERPQEANFVWTQLKVLSFFRKQQEKLDENPQTINPQLGYQQNSFLTLADSQKYATYMASYGLQEERSDERLLWRGKGLRYGRVVKATQVREQRMQNHLINNYVIGNKKALFHTMSAYFKQRGEEPFNHLPLTFHISNGLEDPHYYQFLKYYHRRNREISKTSVGKKQFNAWIVKPGENSNRGNGIKVCLTLQEVKAVLRMKESDGNGSYRTYIVQAYIERPLLYCKRKFDLRHYILITCINGNLKGYWYRDGYVRTASAEYSLQGGEGSVHLTNDAVQKQLCDYGRFEKGNKLSYDDLSAYIDRQLPQHRGAFYNKVYPRMQELATHAIRACSGAIDPRKLQNNFQLFGLDFMIDAELQVWLIEVNSNPCLELACPLLASLIPRLVENTLQLTLDALFPPPLHTAPRGQQYSRQLEKENRYSLVFDERVEPLQRCSLEVLDTRLQEEEDDVFEDCGEDWDDY